MFTALSQLNAFSLDEPVVDLRFHPAGDRLAICTTSGNVQAYDFPDLKFVGALETESARRVCWSPSDLKSVGVLETGSARHVCWSPDGSLVAVPREGEMVVLEASTWRVARKFPTSGIWRIHDITFSRDGAWLAASGSVRQHGVLGDGVAKVWDIKTGDEVGNVSECASPTAKLAFSSDSSKLLLTGDGIFLWNTEDWTEVSRAETYIAPVCDLSSEAGALITASDSRSIELYDTQTSTRERVYERFTLTPTALALSPDKQRFAAGYADGALYLWDSERDAPSAFANTGSKLLARSFTPGSKLLALCFSPDDQRLVSSNESGEVAVWDVADRLPAPHDPPRAPDITESQSIKAHRGPAIGFFSLDGGRLMSGGGDDFLRVWDAASGEKLWSTRTRYSPIPRCTPDGQSVVAQYDAEKIRQWNIEDKKIVGEFFLPDRQVV